MSDIPGPTDPLTPLDAPPSPDPGPASAQTAAALRPIPFEDLEAIPGFWARVGAMFRLVFSNPMELFDRVPTTGGLGAPWRFLLLMSVPVFLITALLFFLLGMGIMVAALEEAGKPEGRVIAAAMPLVFGALLLLMPLFTFLGMVVFGALSHAFLWMWGGLKPGVGVGQSIRAYGYASAFIQLGAWIPTLGFLIQIAGLVVIGMGLARMHKTEAWRGICAVLTPLLLICCCGFMLIMAVPAVLAAVGR